MPETFDISKLLPAEDVQRMAMRAVSPTGYRDSGTPETNEFQLWIHFYTGRVPTSAEFLYGLYFDKVGDSHKTKPLPLSDRYCGNIAVRSSGTNQNFASNIERQVRMSGMQHPPEGSPTLSRSGTTPVATDPRADLSWLTDMSFAADYSYTPSDAGKLSELRDYVTADAWAGVAAPTFFIISKSKEQPHTVTHHGRAPNVTDNIVAIDMLRKEDPLRRPLILGTVGGRGSGAAMELAEGLDFNAQLRPISLRVACNAVA